MSRQKNHSLFGRTENSTLFHKRSFSESILPNSRFGDSSGLGHAARKYEASFVQKPLGLIMSYRTDRHVAVISGFEFLAASLDGKVQIGDEIIACNGLSLDGISQEEASDIILGAAWPLTLKFRRGQQPDSLANPLLSLETEENSSTSPLIPHTVELSRRVQGLNKLTSDIEEASSKLDTHNCMRQQAAVMTLGVVERVPMLLDKLSVLTATIEATRSRLDKLKAQKLCKEQTRQENGEREDEEEHEAPAAL